MNVNNCIMFILAVIKLLFCTCLWFTQRQLMRRFHVVYQHPKEDDSFNYSCEDFPKRASIVEDVCAHKWIFTISKDSHNRVNDAFYITLWSTSTNSASNLLFCSSVVSFLFTYSETLSFNASSDWLDKFFVLKLSPSRTHLFANTALDWNNFKSFRAFQELL